jgi:hypothetical protein
MGNPDGPVMNPPVTGDNSVGISHFSASVVQSIPVDVGKPAARLEQYCFRSASVPDLGMGAQVNIEVGGTFADQSDLQSDTADPNLIRDSKALSQFVDSTGTMGAAHRDRHMGSVLLSGYLQRMGLAVVFENGADPLCR